MRGKKITSLILALILVASSTLFVSAEGYTTIQRSSNLANDDYSHKEVSVATDTTDKATFTLQVKRNEDTFDIYSLVTITPKSTNLPDGPAITNLEYKWVDAVSTFITAHTDEFPLSEYGDPNKLSYKVVAGATKADRDKIEAENTANEKKLIALLRELRKDATAMAALTKVAELRLDSIADEANGVWTMNPTTVGEATNLNTATAVSGVKIEGNTEYTATKYTFNSLAYTISGLPFGLYFIDAKNSNRTDNGGYQPVVYNLVPQQTGPSGHWYMDNTQVAYLKYEGIGVEKQINGKDSDIIRNGEIVSFRVRVDIPEYAKDKDGNYKFKTFTAFDDMSQGFTLIASSARISYFDKNDKEYHRDANFIPGGFGNVGANDTDTNGLTTYEAYLNGISIPFYSTAVGENQVLFYATPSNDAGTIANIWAVVDGVLTQIARDITIATTTEGQLSYSISRADLISINEKLPIAQGMSNEDIDQARIRPITYVDADGVEKVLKKSIIGIIFTYQNLMNPAVYAAEKDVDDSGDKNASFTYPAYFEVTYDAIVNETVYVGTSDNTNKVLAYYVADSTGTVDHADTEVVAWTYGAHIVKVDGENFEKYEALGDDTAAKAEMASNPNTPVFLKDAKFNIYRLDSVYCGGAAATTEPTESQYSKYAYYTDSDSELAKGLIGKTITRDADGTITANARYSQAVDSYVGKGGLLQKAVQYELTQKGGVVDKQKVTATNTAVGAIMKVPAFNHGYATADKFTNKYDFDAIYTTDFATLEGMVPGVEGAVNLSGLRTSKDINVLLDYMYPMISVADTNAPDYTKHADFGASTQANTFVMYLPVEVDSCEVCATKHYHLEAYTLFWRDAVSNGTEGGIKLKGLDPNKYLLVETEAPTGYNPLGSALYFEINEQDVLGTGEMVGFRSDVDEKSGAYTDYDTGYYPFTVRNYDGLVLPSTGGMGTLIFTIIGIIVMLAAILFVMIRNKKFAKSAASFMLAVLVVGSLVLTNTLTVEAVKTINLDNNGAATGTTATQITDPNGNIKITVKVATEDDKLELYRITAPMEMQNGVFKEVTWSEKVASLSSAFETDYPDDFFLFSPQAFADATPDEQSLFLNYIDKHKEMINLAADQVSDSMISINKGGDDNWYATVTGTSARPLRYGVYLVKGTSGTGSAEKHYQVLTINAVPTVQGPLGGYYLSDESLNVTLKYQDLLVSKKVNDKDYDFVREGESVDFTITGEVPEYLPISEDGRVLTSVDGDAFTRYDYSKYQYVMTDNMSPAFLYDAQTGITVEGTTDGTNYAAIDAGKYKVMFTDYFGERTPNVGLMIFNDTTDPNHRYQLLGDVAAQPSPSTSYQISWYLFDTKSKSIEFISTTTNVAAGQLTMNTTVGPLATPFKTKTNDYRVKEGIDSKAPTFLWLTEKSDIEKVPNKNITFNYKTLRDDGIKGVRISYKATITKDCLTGVDTNTNTANFWYRMDVAGNYDPSSSTVRVYTFGLNVLKTDGEEGTYLAGAEFELYKEAAVFIPSATTIVTAPGEESVSYADFVFKKGAANDEFKNLTLAQLKELVGVDEGDSLTANNLAAEYYFRYVAVDAKGDDCGDTCAEGAHVHIHAYKSMALDRALRAGDNKVMVDDNHKIISIADEIGSSVYGLEPGSYVLIETKSPVAADGTEYNILTEAMRFEITPLSEEILSLTENSTMADNKALALAGFISNIQVEKTDKTTDLVYLSKLKSPMPEGAEGDDQYVSLLADFAANKYYQGYPNGIYKINVKNFKGLTLPSTGGIGTLIFTILGIVIMLSVIITVLIKRRKTDSI